MKVEKFAADSMCLILFAFSAIFESADSAKHQCAIVREKWRIRI